MSDIAIIVPVLNRPHRALPNAGSVQSDRARVYAVVTDTDVETCAAWVATRTNVLTTPAVSFAEKVNHAYRLTGEQWLFLVGDDVAFRPGWDVELLRAAEESGASVIGSNDLADIRDEAHAPHMLISRQYVAEFGASWDGPGVVCHEGYRHMFVDDEIVTVAKQRGVYAFARDAVVEHLHPVVDKAEVDATYRLGWSYAEVDKSRFAERMREHAL